MRTMKKISIIIFTMAILLINIPNCYADWASINTQLNTGGSSGGSGGGDGDEKDPISENNGMTYDGYSYSYSYNYKYNPQTSISASGYDVKGKYIFDSTNSTSFKTGNNILAGTFVNVAVKEEKQAYWKVYNIIVEENIKKVTCYDYIEGYWVNDTDVKLNGALNCGYVCPVAGNNTYDKETDMCDCKHKVSGYYDWWESDWVNINASNDCENDYTYSETETEKTYDTRDVTDTSIIKEATDLAAYKMSEQANTYVKNKTIQVTFNNQANEYQTSNENNTSILTGKSMAGYPKLTSSATTSGTSYGKYAFYPSNTCINLKTSKVRYTENCDEDGEISLNENTGDYYWKYFVPLNTKSYSEFDLKIVKSASDGGKLSSKECINVMKNYKNYEDYIQPNSDIKCNGEKQSNFCKDYKSNDYKSSEDYNSVIDHGCQISISVNFNISQEFYNEVTQNEEKKFNGFNFYYRPIDISNPFPNGLGEKSLWSDYWKKEEKKLTNITLTNSYSNDDITYYTNINESLIKRHNKNNSYTSWSKMSIDGSSEFINTGIDSTKMIFKTGNETYYKLGCGPANDTENDAQYMSRCKK